MHWRRKIKPKMCSISLPISNHNFGVFVFPKTLYMNILRVLSSFFILKRQTIFRDFFKHNLTSPWEPSFNLTNGQFCSKSEFNHIYLYP
jgi:hypothetical protein